LTQTVEISSTAQGKPREREYVSKVQRKEHKWYKEAKTTRDTSSLAVRQLPIGGAATVNVLRLCTPEPGKTQKQTETGTAGDNT
jgi:hypothetical protein